ncbi:hypothetical protein [Aquimarina sp. RZ0]|uniref:hypothetical protein n=1 Tax=Aquimarina sp. RZ0 TaxID=2607730 RepID=UPI0011F23564|nr:hypothetical protein [Aquimarina sp. RZ0]KAA1247640.1 hypothetical protein F0000_02200 [Aquimarina sp. RZ0]
MAAPSQFTILANGNSCEFVAANDWIHVYKEVKRGINIWNPLDTYYFKTKYAPSELIRLTKNNLTNTVHNTPHELKVANFLRNHTIVKKGKSSDKLLLIKV